MKIIFLISIIYFLCKKQTFIVIGIKDMLKINIIFTQVQEW